MRSTSSLKVSAVLLALMSPVAVAGDPCPPEVGARCGTTEPGISFPSNPAALLRGPVDVEGRRALVGRPLPDPPPRAPVLPVRDVLGVSYYVDASHSIVDPALKRKNTLALAPLRKYVAGVLELAEGWMESRPAKPAYAIDAVDALGSWADAGALLGAVNQQGEYEREWTLGSLSLAYLEVRAAPGVDAGKLAAIDGWLTRIAEAVRPYYDRPGRKSDQNNHACWVGLAVAAAGAATQGRALFTWGLARGRLGMEQIRVDGFLPLELERKRLALHYHLFALAPLVMLAELAEANGVHLYGEDRGALRRLADRVVAGLRDPAAFSAAAGGGQETRLPPRGADLAWAEIYFARFHDQRLTAWIATARPLRDDRLGGDLTAAFGVPGLK